ncbi:pyridoxal phosphate-dependent aminotransferase [Pseudomarimonas salicorniae]|uniref:Aminotransferase n=1 Tax=Pseudomarimonas salicorniae TaxID=2933270 RepID=A0ABT0GF05_9GAMM|nr:pyridoxal phosphate-dependent aminotransferase [Lysobacter sp. CAU 1642]MCK7593125.1 pyridoxal phosphate-dependent aminotransferase [Lysobacter sp. CAU 1642]
MHDTPSRPRFPARIERLTADPASQAWALHGKAIAMQLAGREVCMLSVGDPDFDTPPSIGEAAWRALRAGRTHYPAIAGDTALRGAIAAHHRELSGSDCDPGQVQVFAGAQNALFMLMQALAGEGDEVIIADPYYATYPGVIAACGARMRALDTRDSGWHLTAAGIAAALTPATRVVLLNSPSNPCGVITPAEEVERIVELCRRQQLWLVADEVYGELMFEGGFHSVWRHHAEHDRIVVIGSASKRFAMTGWRLGWCLAPPDLIVRLKALATAGLFGTPPFLQDALAEALTAPPAEAEAMRREYAERARTVLAALDHCPGLQPIVPSAGMFVSIDLSGHALDGTAFAEALLADEAVALMPGIAFGESLRQGLRLSLVAPRPRLAEACAAIRRVASRWATAAAEA